MAKRNKAINPFYPLLVLAGMTFAVTAFAYGVMAFRATHGTAPFSAEQPGGGLLMFLDEEGMLLMTVELVVLGIASCAAIVTDGYWTRRSTVAAPESSRPAAESSAAPLDPAE